MRFLCLFLSVCVFRVCVSLFLCCVQTWIDEVGSIGCGDDEHLFEGHHPVHLREELAEHARAHAAAAAGAVRAPGGQRVDLVEKDNRRSRCARLSEECGDSTLGFAHPL